jgi:hypothetical protein
LRGEYIGNAWFLGRRGVETPEGLKENARREQVSWAKCILSILADNWMKWEGYFVTLFT